MDPYVINYARFTETRLIDSNNTFHQKVYIRRAKDMAREANLDLVCFSEPAINELALCKIVDFGKWKYQQEKAKKKEHSNKVATKEIQFTPVIGDHDLDHKVKQIIGFLKDGDEVVVNMRFRGIHHRLVGEGERIIGIIMEKTKDVGKEAYKKKTGDNIYLRLVKL